MTIFAEKFGFLSLIGFVAGWSIVIEASGEEHGLKLHTSMQEFVGHVEDGDWHPAITRTSSPRSTWGI